jgi:hypothetical protein
MLGLSVPGVIAPRGKGDIATGGLGDAVDPRRERRDELHSSLQIQDAIQIFLSSGQ